MICKAASNIKYKITTNGNFSVFFWFGHALSIVYRPISAYILMHKKDVFLFPALKHVSEEI